VILFGSYNFVIPKGSLTMAQRGSDIPRLTLVAFRAPVELVEDLEIVAERRNEPKSTLIREALNQYLAEPKNRRGNRKAS